MRECLDEGILQSFCDGELSGSQLDRVTTHLTHCSACSSTMQELLSDSELVATALEPEFQAAVPSERLRARINAAVDGLSVPTQQTQGVSSWFGSLSSLFALRPQQALGYAGLVAVLAFAGVFGIAYFKQPRVVSNQEVAQNQRNIKTPQPPAPGEVQQPPAQVVPTPEETGQKNKTQNPQETQPPRVRPSRSPYVPREAVAKVKLLPGEKNYLKTIAALDSTIKSANDKPMQPALRTEYERNLALVDRALAAARNAAKKNPNDPDAAEFVFAAYQSKVDLLNTVADARVYNRVP